MATFMCKNCIKKALRLNSFISLILSLLVPFHLKFTATSKNYFKMNALLGIQVAFTINN